MGMGGIQRVFHIPENLRRLGWKVNIYTPYTPRGYPIDNTLIKGNNLEVIRTFSPDPLHLLPGKFSGVGKGRRDYFTFPDNKIPWIPFLLKSLGSMDTIITSCPPFSLLLTGLVKNKTPWIIDFRDPWSGSYLGKYRFKWEEELANGLEKYAIKHASAVISVTKNHKEYLISRYPEHQGKIHLIRNGYDEENFPEAEYRVKDEDIIITYMGTFNIHHNPRVFFEGLEELFKIRPWVKNKIVLKHIGHGSGIDVKRWTEKVGIGKFIATGYLPHRFALRELLNSDILLLLGEKGKQDREIIPGKLYEYLRSKIPIIAVTVNEEIEELIGSAGLCCNFNPVSVAQAILKVIENPDQFKTIKNYGDYSWRNLSRKYSKLLSSVL